MSYLAQLNLCSPELEGGDVPGGEDGAVVPGQVLAAVSAHLGGPGVSVPDGQPVKPAAPGPACLQPELGEGEPDYLRTEISDESYHEDVGHHLALRHPDGVVTGEGVAILGALPWGEVNEPGGRVIVTSTCQHLQHIMLMMFLVKQ